MFLSIIIPVYNVEKYLCECLDSCLEQDIATNEYEIIGIDDGSPDNCGKILDGYAKKFDNIKVVHKENGGVSSARNAGIDIANGDYIWFVDPDDFIEPNILLNLKHRISSFNKDKITIGLYHMKSETLTQDEIEARSNKTLKAGPCYLCGQIFKASIIKTNSIHFHTDVSIEEDNIFSFEYQNFQKSDTLCIDEIIYFYRNNPNSLLHSDKVKMLPSRINMAAIMRQHYINNFGDNVYSEYSAILNTYRSLEIIYSLPKKKRKEYLDLIKQKKIIYYKVSKDAKEKFDSKKPNINKMLFCLSTTKLGYISIYLYKKWKNICSLLHQ